MIKEYMSIIGEYNMTMLTVYNVVTLALAYAFVNQADSLLLFVHMSSLPHNVNMHELERPRD